MATESGAACTGGSSALVPSSSILLWSVVYCLLALGCLGVRAACCVDQGVPVERGAADWEVTGSHTHACMHGSGRWESLAP